LLLQQSTWKVLPRNIQMHIEKEKTGEEFWARLLKDKALEKTNVKIDWNKYVDEDDDGDARFDMSALDGGSGFGGGMGGGMPGMGGMEGMGEMGNMEEMMSKLGAGGMGGMGGMGG
ncbi:unnamed protein product, partial [Choristocarpus tenellus]